MSTYEDCFYSEQDSIEVRRIWWAAMHGKDDRRPMIVTEKEYAKFQASGADMEGYVTLKDFKNEQRMREINSRIKINAANKRK